MRCTHASTILFTLAIAACGGGGTNPAVDGAGDDTPEPDAALQGDRYSVTWGPVTVQPGQEDTRCATLKLSNTTPIKIHQVHNTLSQLSHHFIVYRDNSANPVENPTPTPCQPFAGTLDLSGGRSPIMITQRTDEVLTLPDGVAYSFGANQFVRLEMHFINGGDVAGEATATAEFYAVPDADIHDEAEFLFIGSPDISLSLAPGASDSINAYFPVPAGLDGVNYFALTGHTHQLGSDMDVSTAVSAAGARTEVYNPTPFSWSEPETTMYDPPFTVPSGGGFDFTCAWTNTGTEAVSASFGESANDEMCFFWAYYYPSRGAKVCIHTDQFGGFNGCCPDLPTICNALGIAPL